VNGASPVGMTATGPAELFEQVQADSTNITMMAKLSNNEGESCSLALSKKGCINYQLHTDAA